MVKKEFEECPKCRHWYSTKERCADTFQHEKVFSKEEHKTVCSRFGLRW